MNRRRRLAILLFTLLLTCSLAAKALALPDVAAQIGSEKGAAATPAAPAVTAEYAALAEMRSGRILFEKQAEKRAYMASTTKVMTALVAVEQGDLDAVVEVPNEAAPCEGSSIYLARGERLSMRDLLYGLMLASGNDAAIAIASQIGGSIAGFAELMNVRADELGCTGTHFVNPNGLPDENHYTTALDLTKIAACAMQNAGFRKIVSATYHETTTGDRARTFKNKNKILWQYDGGNGVKTGFTKAAGRCLVFSAQRGDMTLVGCVLNAPDMWEDAKKLLDYGFDRVQNQLLVDAARPISFLAVTGGTKKSLAIYPKEDILYPIALDGGDIVSWEMDCADAANAPLAPGTQVGTLTLNINGAAAQTVALVVTEGVPCVRLSDYVKAIAAGWSG